MEPNVDAERPTRMRTAWLIVLAATTLVTGCGSVPGIGSDIGDELRTVADWDGDRDPRWAGFGIRSPLDIVRADDAPPIAAVAWTEAYDGSSVVDQVEATVGCDDRCVGEIEAWATERLATGTLAAVASEDLCGNCAEAGRLSFVKIDAAGGFEVVERDDLAAVVGEIDTPYEVMVTVGKSAKVRPEGAGWRAVLYRVVADCDPFIGEHTMWSIDRQGEQEQLASFEESDNSCA